MSNPSMNPGSRPRKGLVTVAGLAAGALGLGALVFAATETARPSAIAGAVELSTFASCDELDEWAAETEEVAAGWSSGRETFAASVEDSDAAPSAAQDGAGDSVESGPGSGAPATTITGDEAEQTAGGDDTGDTNVDVVGVDEIDLVDRLDDDHVLVAANGRLAVVDLAAGRVTSSVAVTSEAQISYDPDAGVAWAVGTDWTEDQQVVVTRVAVDGTDLSVDGEWRTRGSVVAAHRTGGELYLVATDGFRTPMPGVPIEGEGDDVGLTEEGSVGSAGAEDAEPDLADDPDDEWNSRPPASTTAPAPVDPDEPVTDQPSDEPTTTVPTDEPTEPSEPSEPSEDPTTTEPRTTEPTAPTDPSVPFGGDPVPCDEVLYPNGPSSPAGTLIAAFPATGAVEPSRATEIVGVGDQVHLTLDAAYVSTPLWESDTPTTGIHRFELDTLTPTGSGQVEGTMLDQFSMSERDGHLRVAVTTGTDWMMAWEGDVASDALTGPSSSSSSGDEARNEVVVLDTDGALDVVGRTARFGKPGESIHGVRFVGDTAYAVTFLETDPFYVIDVADPAAPVVVGEVELPGFSSYLHPIDDGRVVGFGPDGDGEIAAKLFDVSDPTAPRVADELSLGAESPIAWDHHAFVARDGGFAVPTLDYREEYAEGCGPAEQDAARQQEEDLLAEASRLEEEGRYDDASAVYGEIDELTCLYPEYRAEAGVAVVDVEGDQLVEVARPTVDGLDTVQRAIPVDGGWGILGIGEIVTLDAGGTVVHRIAIR